ncbi:Sensor histidine kinase DesK [Pseudidiomarina piscicola]|uniref:Sensor histidine kinase DesK n=1 Tax=Pseudidiomarina piscicola TaxID=2614830 RepID=A0A6S6WJE5_9GAMM|nr:sensor histidine kinase [Pseudidiomarina piscicola]CAB0150762.1 Sensor histidine kinase DesK [Pseudidiomarina piscicola]VZT40267.1 Sensor histidine kinase DesK [Pseudomonas aeruginosa]
MTSSETTSQTQFSGSQPKHAWIYLFNLGFYVLPMVLFPYSWLELAGLSLALLVFVGLYFYCYQQPLDRMLWPILAMYGIAIVVTPWNSGSIALFSYVGFFVGLAYRWPYALAGVVGLVATLAIFHWGPGTQWDLFFYYGAVIVSTVAIFGRVERLRQRHDAAQRRSAEEISRLATAVERERIARDLHDILGHTLSSIVLKSDLAQAQLNKQQYDAATKQLGELSAIARDSLSQVRQSVSGYRHNGLQLELERLKQRLSDAGFRTEVSGLPPRLSASQETAVVLALTELVTNVIRHSSGQVCSIHFDETANTYRIQVSDDGTPKEIHHGNGLSGVSQRMQELGGEASLSMAGGCEVKLSIPKLQGALL